MNYYSTSNRNEKVSFREAILQGLAKDKGLFMPERIPTIDPKIIQNLSNLTFQEIATIISKNFIEDEISNNKLEDIINSSISFSAPLINLSNKLSILELFHGPTLAFKDFGARFMARTMEYFIKDETREITILVATSGDTGSAVANGFLNVKGINVIVLYPKGKVSKIQEKQITTLGKNIKALRIDGTFDDCQKLVKTAFVDDDIKIRVNLSSANSINIGRLIPQSFYYFESYKQLVQPDEVVYSIPSGNLGNLTAGLFAKLMGLPINKFIAATNANSVFTEYIDSENFTPRASTRTLSNAMDVGNPSNFFRIVDLFNNDHSMVSNVIYSKSFSDQQTVKMIKDIHDKYNYTIDPHGAVGILAFNEYSKYNKGNTQGVVLETAHPSKFMDAFSSNVDFEPEIPERLFKCLNKDSSFIDLSNSYEEFKEYLLH